MKKKIAAVVMVLGVFVGQMALAADVPETHDQDRLYFVHANPPDTIFRQGINSPGDVQNVHDFATNTECSSSGFISLWAGYPNTMSRAQNLARYLQRTVYVYVVIPNREMYSLSTTLENISASGASADYRAQLNELVRLGDRWFTANSILGADIEGVYEVTQRGLHAPGVTYISNPLHQPSFPSINTGVFPGLRQPTETQSTDYFTLGRLHRSLFVFNICAIASFYCSAQGPRLFSPSSTAQCISKNDLIEVPIRIALAHKMLPILLQSLSIEQAHGGHDEM